MSEQIYAHKACAQCGGEGLIRQAGIQDIQCPECKGEGCVHVLVSATEYVRGIMDAVLGREEGDG